MHQLSRIGYGGVVFAHEHVVPAAFNCQLHARDVAHAAPDGPVRIPNGRKALRLQPHFSELRLKMGAAVYARIQIDVNHMGYVVEIAYGHGLYIILFLLFLLFLLFYCF
jgi:hypothetical protein